ncbi:hypothetical protein [Halogeometricum limi]|uniref:Uncharacterized protein n=1 Tax=Halogeometricum limi TaxID=555875 RepID=A0A1I6IU42_9EURY|nr:hypothetical protein [Halogeometricum limi]SFR70233.1 hypothetical protein SAMN04488124_3678 [Halogeometricum limi]
MDGDCEESPEASEGDPTDCDTIEPAPDALSEADLQYPTFAFDDGAMTPRGGFDLERDLTPEEMREWVSELAGGIGSHDVAVESPDRHATLGVRPRAVSMSFDPDEEYRGTFEVTFTMDAKVMLTGDADAPKAGARGGTGFVPRAMLTDDRDPTQFRCYNWIADPTDPDETR